VKATITHIQINYAEDVFRVRLEDPEIWMQFKKPDPKAFQYGNRRFWIRTAADRIPKEAKQIRSRAKLLTSLI